MSESVLTDLGCRILFVPKDFSQWTKIISVCKMVVNFVDES